jgi:hypothetical protein
MQNIRYVYWQNGDVWLGHLEEYPDYMTQGVSLEDLKEHLLDLYKDFTSGAIPGVRKVAELEIP